MPHTSRIAPSFTRLLTCLAVLGLAACAMARAPQSTPLRLRTLIDADWKFYRGDVSSTNEVISASYDDGKWQRVQLPHDYQLDGDYEPELGHPAKITDARRRGYLPVTVAWYRKHFFIPQSDQGKVLRLEFGGVFRDSQVWLNGQFLGRHPGGYTGFAYDVTKAARCGAENVIAVRVDPREREGWWYEGSGIYRHVYYTALSPLHLAQHGTYVISQVPKGDQGAAAEAELTIQTAVESQGTDFATCGVVSEIVGPDGTVLKSIKTEEVVDAAGQHQFVQRAILERPRLWCLESPSLYQLRTTLLQGGRPVDSTTTSFGIRTIRFDADKGFFLNGKHVEIYGVANHQDFPAVGVAVPDSLQLWRVKQLKQMGCNAWRTAHNEPNDAVLDACDRLGMLVMAENRHLGDSYSKALPGTTCTNLSNLAAMIQKDRNHPSIIMWSLCNEERLQGTPEGASIFSAMKKLVLGYDPTRPITAAMHGGWSKNGFIGVEDLLGINYRPRLYDELHQANPHLPMFGSETANTKTTRGEYQNDPTNGWVSCYNLVEAKLPDMFGGAVCLEGWPSIVSRPFMAGSFTWTGFDYRGEPNPYGWPEISNNTGLMDVCGFPKDKFYYLEACWSDKPMVHLMPATWNWPGREGQNIRVVAFSNARQVELFLNGKSLGVKPMPHDGFLEWQVPYQPGRLLAKASSHGRVSATDQVETAGAPVRVQLSPDRTALQADGQDTVVVPVSLLDAKGRLVPYANNRVTFHLQGGGRILGVGNGNPSDHDPDRANQRNAFHGHCIVLIQGGSNPETLELTATSPGLKPARVKLRVR
jgi:beta-galactosidase